MFVCKQLMHNVFIYYWGLDEDQITFCGKLKQETIAFEEVTLTFSCYCTSKQKVVFHADTEPSCAGCKFDILAFHQACLIQSDLKGH